MTQKQTNKHKPKQTNKNISKYMQKFAACSSGSSSPVVSQPPGQLSTFLLNLSPEHLPAVCCHRQAETHAALPCTHRLWGQLCLSRLLSSSPECLLCFSGIQPRWISPAGSCSLTSGSRSFLYLSGFYRPSRSHTNPSFFPNSSHMPPGKTNFGSASLVSHCI